MSCWAERPCQQRDKSQVWRRGRGFRALAGSLLCCQGSGCWHRPHGPREGVECSPASGGSELSEEEEEVVPSEAAAPGQDEG